MLFRVGPGNAGYNFQPEFIDLDCVLELAAGAVCAQGQPVARDVTAFPSVKGADMVVLPTDPLAVPTIYGVYQGPAFTNSSGARANYPIQVRSVGQGVVSASGATAAVNVGSNLIINAANLAAQAAAAAMGVNVGLALASGSVTAKGAQLIASAGAATLINAAIRCE